MKRGGPLKRKSPLKRSAFISKRKKPDIPASVRKAVHERSGGLCEMRVEGVCTGQAQEIDHIKNRSQGAGHTLEELQDACAACHKFKTEWPDKAHELGIYRRSWE